MDRGVTTEIRIEASGGEPIYQQIFNAVAERIRSGVYPPGYRLPPTRTLARELETHRNTVVRAFEELGAAGFVRTVVGRGTFVAPVGAGASATGGAPALPELPWASLVSRALDAEPLVRMERYTIAAVAPGNREPVNLTRMQPPEDLIPAALLRRCVDHVLTTQGPRALGYAPPEGLMRLRSLIAEDVGREGVPAGPEDVLVTNGSQQALDLLARALVNPGDVFLSEASTYSGAIKAFAAAGAHLVGVPGDGEGPDLDALTRLGRGAKGLYLMPNCHNPTGAMLSFERRRALVAWSHQAGVPLIEDDYAADLDIDGVPAPPALRSLDREVLYMGTYSKKLIPALRIGFLICPPSLRRRLGGLKHTMDLGTSALLQHALAEFLERGYMRAHLNRIIPAYRARRNALEEALVRHLPDDLRWPKPRRGVALWLDLPGLDADAVFEEARRRGVLVTPGSVHGVNARTRAGLRLTYCCEPPERLALGAQRLAAAIEEVRARVRPSPSAETTRIDVV